MDFRTMLRPKQVGDRAEHTTRMDYKDAKGQHSRSGKQTLFVHIQSKIVKYLSKLQILGAKQLLSRTHV